MSFKRTRGHGVKDPEFAMEEATCRTSSKAMEEASEERREGAQEDAAPAQKRRMKTQRKM
jgi:hypothetical protein